MTRIPITPAAGARGVLAVVTATEVDAAMVTAGAAIISHDSNRLLIRATNTGSDVHRVIVRCGDNKRTAFLAGQGDVIMPLLPGTSGYLPGVDTARVRQSDKTMHIDFSSGFTGTIEIMLLPKY